MEYELLIPMWNAVIPQDWELEFQNPKATGYESASGRTIVLVAGALLRGHGGPEEQALKNMLDQGYVKAKE